MELIRRLGTDEQRTEIIGKLASGDVVGAIALADLSATDSSAMNVRDDKSGLTARLSGHTGAFFGAVAADLVVVAAVGPDDAVHAYVVTADTPGVSVVGCESFDSTRPLGYLVLNDAPAVRLGGPSETAAVAGMVDVGRALVSAEMVGTAERCLEMAVDYAETRQQFGRPIGSFQAIKHRCADMAVELDAATVACLYSVMVIDAEPEQLPTAALIAKAQASQALTACAAGSMHVHGGMGFTWEHDAHLYFRRAKALEPLFGSIDAHWDLLASRVL